MRSIRALIAFSFLAGLTVATNPNLKYFGWYHDGAAPSEFAGWTNLFYGGDWATLEVAHSLGMTPLLAVGDLLFTSVGGDCPIRLHPQYKERWAAALPDIKAHVANHTLGGFWLGDELLWNGLSVEELTKATDEIRASFPRESGLFMWENEAAPIVSLDFDMCAKKKNFDKVPPSLDYFSIDLYHFDGSDPLFISVVLREFYKLFIYPKMNLASQKVFLVPGSFASEYNKVCNVTCYDKMCAQDAELVYSWVSEDVNVGGVVPWHWLYQKGCIEFKDEIGTSQLPLSKPAWQKVGREIIKQASAP